MILISTTPKSINARASSRYSPHLTETETNDWCNYFIVLLYAIVCVGLIILIIACSNVSSISVMLLCKVIEKCYVIVIKWNSNLRAKRIDTRNEKIALI